MFDFIPHSDFHNYKDSFLNEIGAVIGYSPISDLKNVSDEAVSFLGRKGWTINRKGLPVEAVKDNQCLFVLKKKYCLVLFKPQLGEDMDYILSILKVVLSLLSNVGISTVSLYWKVGDKFKFKETLDIEQNSSEIRSYLLSGKLLQDRDKYEVIENNISLHIEYSKVKDDNSCNLSVYVLTVSNLLINKALETFRDIVNLVTSARLYTLSENILQIIKRK